MKGGGSGGGGGGGEDKQGVHLRTHEHMHTRSVVTHVPILLAVSPLATTRSAPTTTASTCRKPGIYGGGVSCGID